MLPLHLIKQILLPAIVLIGGLALDAGAQEISSPFNQLVLEKADLEKRSAVRTLECFSFVENIGFTEDQKTLVGNCLAGLRTLKEALAEVPEADYHTVGISHRFLRSGGFQTILVPWDAGKEEMVRFLKKRLSDSERARFLDNIFSLKRQIAEKLRSGPLYCGLNISNEQCLEGYQNLARAASLDSPRKIRWRETVVTDTFIRKGEPYTLALKYNAEPQKMLEYLRKDPQREWKVRKRMYEKIESLYQKNLESRLRLANLFCAPEVTEEACLQGFSSLNEASEDKRLQDSLWGQVTIDKYNTIIRDDHNMTIRYDLPAAEMIRYFSSRESGRETTEHHVRAEKLEKRSMNNPSGLRPVCDLGGIRSALCGKGFETFVGFVSANREFRAAAPWSEVMFIDGGQLPRVNFALNSNVRKSYIYIDADSSPEEFAAFIKNFSRKEPVND